MGAAIQETVVSNTNGCSNTGDCGLQYQWVHGLRLLCHVIIRETAVPDGTGQQGCAFFAMRYGGMALGPARPVPSLFGLRRTRARVCVFSVTLFSKWQPAAKLCHISIPDTVCVCVDKANLGPKQRGLRLGRERL